MNEAQGLILLISVIFAMAGMAIVLAWWRRKHKPRPVQLKGKTVDFECSLCHQQLAVTRANVALVSPAEMALAVGTRPNLVGRTLAEYTCPYCEAVA